MVICGDDGLAHRLAVELDAVCGEIVTVVLPSASDQHGAQVAELHRDPQSPVELHVSARPDERTLRAAGVQRAAALALTYRDDQVNMTAALLARTVNPSVRLVVRMFDRERGRHLERLLDRAAGLCEDLARDTSTTVLSDADTAVPELVAAAALGRGHTLQVEGRVFRGVVRPAGTPSHATDLATLAVLSGAHQDDPASQDSAETPGDEGTQLLPDTGTARRRQGTHGRLILEEVGRPPAEPAVRTRRFRPRKWLRARLARLPWKVFLSHQLAAVYGALAAVVVALSTATALFTDEHPWWKNFYLPLLDIFTMGDPATQESPARRVLQLLAGFVGLAVLPLVVAATMNATEAFRTASASHPPDEDVNGHIVLVGLGMVGTRVLARLHGTGQQVVAIECDPQARGVALARELGIPLILDDATLPGVLDRARVRQSRSLLVLTRDDGRNLDIVMAVRETDPEVRVVTRLYDDGFAATVQRTLRASYPDALTRSRSVSALAAPSFAAAMMGRHVLGVMPVERGSLLFTCVDVAGHPELEGRSVHEAFRANEWRVLAVGAAAGPLPQPAAADTDGPAGARVDRTRIDRTRVDRTRVDRARVDRADFDRTGFDWRPEQGRLLRAGDRVVLATTRRGLDILLADVHR